MLLKVKGVILSLQGNRSRVVRTLSFWIRGVRYAPKGRRHAARFRGPLSTDAVDKRFSTRESATLNQNSSLSRNIDSKNAAIGFDYCQCAA
jgi:hypothetical protein